MGLVVLLQAAQHGVDEGPEVGALGDGADKHVLIQGRGAAAARTAVQVPGGGGGFLIEAPHGAQLQQRGKRHAQDHGLVHAQAHLLQFLQQLFRLGSVPGAGQQKQEGGFGLHEPPFRPLVGQQSLLIRAGEPVRLRQRDAGQIEVRGRFQRRKAVQLFLHGALLGRLAEQQLLQKALFRCSPPGGGGCMHQIMLQQLQQTLGQDLVLRSKGVFPLMLHPQACSMFHGCFPFVNQEGHRFMNEGTWVQGKSMNVMHQTGNVAWSIFDADYGKYNRMSLENGTGGDMEVTVTITDGKISDIVVNSHAESSDIGAPALDKLIQNAIAANSAEIDGASGATMTSDGFREAVAQALAKAQ